MTGNAHERMIELMDEAGQCYFSAVKSGMKLQQEVADWWAQHAAVEAPSGGFDPKALADEAITKWKAASDDAIAMMEQGAKKSLDLLNRAFEVGQTDSLQAAQKKLNELWESSIKTAQDNVKEMLSANEKVAKAWMEVAQRKSEAAAAP